MEASLEMATFLLGIIGSFGTIIVGALLVADGKLNFGIVMAVVTLQMSMSSSMQRFGSSLAAFSTSVVRAGHVFDFLELEQEECVGWNTQTQVGTVDLHDKCNVAIELYKLHFHMTTWKIHSFIMRGLRWKMVKKFCWQENQAVVKAHFKTITEVLSCPKRQCQIIWQGVE